MRYFCATAVTSFLIALSATSASAAELALVEDGVSQAPIVLFEAAPPFTRRATNELATYIEKISGARPEIIEGKPDPIPEHAIWVGHQPVMDELFPDVDFEFEHPEEVVIAANENHLVIAGRDRWTAQGLKTKDKRGNVINGVQQEYGTINAVYTFLQDYLDVRWFWPGELGEDIATKETIAFEPFMYRHHPQIRGRSGIFSFSSLGNRGYGRSHRWTRLQRLQLDSLYVPGGHAFNDWWERFHQTHPEYFALQPDGTRGGENPYPSAHNIKLCLSNPDVARQWVDDVAKQLADHRNQTVFNASPNDGYLSGHCICKDCRAWDHPEGEPRQFTWRGISQKYVALSDRHVTFANRCARLLRERYPDKNYLVLMMAYGNSIPAPRAAVPEDNVVISFVGNFHNRKGRVAGSDTAAYQRKMFSAWGQVAPKMAWRPNLGYGIWVAGLPKVAMDLAISDLRQAAENHCTGIYFDSVWEHWATQGPHYYMLAQIAWNPEADGEAILADYYQRAFGPAAGEMKAYWTLMQDATREIVADGEGNLSEIYNQAFFDTAYGYLDSAKDEVSNEPEKFRQRIEFVQTGLDYTQLMMEARALVVEVRAGNDPASAAAKRAREIWVEQIKPLAQSEEYPQAINWGPIRPGHNIPAAFYPDDLNHRW